MSQVQEVGEQAETDRAAPLGVELSAEDPPPAGHGRELPPMPAVGQAELLGDSIRAKLWTK
jgi:hypothetical protein